MENETMDAETKKRIQEQEKKNVDEISEILEAAKKGMKFVTNITFDHLLDKSRSFNAEHKGKEKHK